MKRFCVVIPARFGSSRLPGKPLLDLCGKPMICRVAEQVLKSNAREIVVATDDQRIMDAVQGLPVKRMLTPTELESGTDRVHAVARDLEWEDDTIVVNVQGDEPLIPPQVIDQVAKLLLDNPSFAASTLSGPIHAPAELTDPNVVKVVCDPSGKSLYFSRAPIPWDRDNFSHDEISLERAMWNRHIGIYAYRVWALNQFVTMKRSPLEKTESLEQLRFLESGHSIIVEKACRYVPLGLDTEQDAQRIRQELLKDSTE